MVLDSQKYIGRQLLFKGSCVFLKSITPVYLTSLIHP